MMEILSKSKKIERILPSAWMEQQWRIVSVEVWREEKLSCCWGGEWKPFSNWKFLKRKNISIFTREKSLYLSAHSLLYRVTIFSPPTPSHHRTEGSSSMGWMKHEEERTNQGLIGEGRNELTSEDWRRRESRDLKNLKNIFFVQMMSSDDDDDEEWKTLQVFLAEGSTRYFVFIVVVQTKFQSEGLFSIYKRAAGWEMEWKIHDPIRHPRRVSVRRDDAKIAEFINESHQLFKSLTKLIDWSIRVY